MAYPAFFIAPAMNPRIVWFFQPVSLAIAAIVAPPLARSMSITMAFFENSRGTAVFLAADLLVPAFLAARLPLGAFFFRLAAFVAAAFFAATCAPCSAMVAAVLSAVFVAFAVDPLMPGRKPTYREQSPHPWEIPIQPQ